MMKATVVPIEDHTTHSQRLMEHAEEQLEKGDRLQASEKAWGAIAHQIKAIAYQRGWKYETHQQVYPIIRRLARETDDPARLRELFSTVTVLHQNFYADTMPLNELAFEVGRAKALLRILQAPELIRPRRRRHPQPDRTFRKRRGL